MSIADGNTGSKATTITIGLSDNEREKELALRERFANFWSSATGEPRAIYDTFIASCPIAQGIALEAVDEDEVRGWWVRPSTANPGEAILFLHGGGYVQGSATAYRGFASQLVALAGIPALVIDYPLAPESPWPAAPEAALSAWRWLVSGGFERIAIIGDSAGGGLTLVTLLGLKEQRHGPKPIAGVVFSPWTDLSLTGASMTDPSVNDPLLGHEYMRECASKFLGSTNARVPTVSPLFGDLQDLPPLLIQVGTDELLLEDSRRMAERAAAAGVSVQLEIWEGMHHVFQLDVDHLNSSRVALYHAAQFIRNA